MPSAGREADFGKLSGLGRGGAPGHGTLMKRSERHHLKANPLATLLADLSETNWFSTRAVSGAAVVAGALVIAGAVFGWQQYRSAQASGLLAEAMAIVDAPVVSADGTGGSVEGSPASGFATVEAKMEAALPRLLETADAYPGLSQGIAARYQAAVALGVLGRAGEAESEYERVMELDAGGVYGRMARLGRAEALLDAGNFERAIALLAEASAASVTDDAGLPRDALLMRLGQAYVLSGQPAEAASTFQQLIDEFPASGYRFDAQRELSTLLQPSDG